MPSTRFKVLRDGEFEELDSSEIFKGRRIVLFALPGAYTPTCSSGHVPRFVELAAELRTQRVGDIVCPAVNDPFVMAAWQREQHAEALTFLPDADASFTSAMGMLVASAHGGIRCS